MKRLLVLALLWAWPAFAQSGATNPLPGYVFTYLGPTIGGDWAPPTSGVPGSFLQNHVVCYGTAFLFRSDCTDVTAGAIIGPSTFPSQSPGLNVKPSVPNSVVMYLEGYGLPLTPSAFPLYFVMRDYSTAHSVRIDIQAVNQAGTVQDSAAFINPGYQWWTTGHEQTDFDFGGCRNGVCGLVLAYLSSGCQSAFNNSVGGPACPTDLPASFGPGSDGLLDLAGPNNRFGTAYMVKAQIKQTTNQNILLAGPLNLPTGTSLQSYLDNLNPTQFELSASNIQFFVPAGYTRTKIGTNKNITIQNNLNLSDGLSIQSLDDTLAVAKGLELVGSTIRLTGPVTAPSTPTGTPTASLCLDAGGAIIKKTTAGSCI